MGLVLVFDDALSNKLTALGESTFGNSFPGSTGSTWDRTPPEALLRHVQLEAELPESSIPGRAWDGVNNKQ